MFRAPAADREVRGRKKVVLPRPLVHVGRHERQSIEIPERLHARPAVRVAGAEAQAHPRAEDRPQVRALERVGIFVVRALPAGVELVPKHVVVETPARAGCGQKSVRGGECAPVGAEHYFRGPGRTLAAPGLQHAGHRIGAVQRALGPAHELQPLNLRHGNHAEVEGASGIVHHHPVNYHLVVA